MWLCSVLDSDRQYYRKVWDALASVESALVYRLALCGFHPLPLLFWHLGYPWGPGRPRLESHFSSICHDHKLLQRGRPREPGTDPGIPCCSTEQSEVDVRALQEGHLRSDTKQKLTIQTLRRKGGWGHSFWPGCSGSPPQEKRGSVPESTAQMDRWSLTETSNTVLFSNITQLCESQCCGFYHSSPLEGGWLRLILQHGACGLMPCRTQVGWRPHTSPHCSLSVIYTSNKAFEHQLRVCHLLILRPAIWPALRLFSQ